MRVALVSLPFAPLNSPSMALGILHSISTARGHETKSFYFAPSLAAKIGKDLYIRIAEGEPSTTAMAGEWCFASATNNLVPDSSADYLQEVLSEADFNRVSADFIENLQKTKNFIPEFVNNCLSRITDYRPDVIGLTTVFQQTNSVIALCKEIRKTCPDAFIVVGGANCEDPMGTVLLKNNSCLDAIVSGEGEPSWMEILDALAADRCIRQVPGLRLRNSLFPPLAGGFVDLNSSPTPNYDDYFSQINTSFPELSTRLLVESSRGCWWGAKNHCIFCGLNGGSMEFREKNATRFHRELQELVDRYPASAVSAVDNIIPQSYFKSLLPQLAAQGIGIPIFYETKSNLNRNEIIALARAGIKHIQPGIESLSDSVLKLIKKGVSGAQNIYLLKLCREFGITVEWNFLWGFPNEDESEYHQMAGFIPTLLHLEAPGGWGAVRLDRYSPLYLESGNRMLSNIVPAASYSKIFPDYSNSDLENVAYYFTFNYLNGQNPADYTSSLRAQLKSWGAANNQFDVLLIDKDTFCLVWDTRPSSAQQLYLLRGDMFTIFKACDSPRSVGSLSEETGISVERIQIIAATLVNRRLLIRIGERVMSVAIIAGNYEPKGQSAARLAELFKRCSVEKWNINQHELCEPNAPSETLKVVRWLLELGAHQKYSGGRSLFDHLIGVWDEVGGQSQSFEAIAALIHSIYGVGNVEPLVSDTKRDAVREIAGDLAEQAAWRFCREPKSLRQQDKVLRIIDAANTSENNSFHSTSQNPNAIERRISKQKTAPIQAGAVFK